MVGNAQQIPPQSNPPRLVNDYAGVLNDVDENLLEQKLVQFNDSTSTQIAIVLIRSTGEYPVDDYAITLFRDWGIGQKNKDNGVLILAAMEDRRMTIITGYGVEGALPDAICKRIIELKLKPAFKSQQYYQGLDAAVTEIMQRTKGEFVSDGENVSVGKPYVANAKVKLEVVKNFKGDKVIVFKKRRRKTSKVKKGFRQSFTQLKVIEIIK